MDTLGRFATVSFAMAVFGQQVLAQEKDTPKRRNNPAPVQEPRALPAKPVLPVVQGSQTQEADRIDKRRERMKDRDREIDRMLKQKAKR